MTLNRRWYAGIIPGFAALFHKVVCEVVLYASEKAKTGTIAAMKADKMNPAEANAATPAKMLPFARALATDVQTALQSGLQRPVAAAALLAAAETSHQFYEQTWRYIQSLNVVQHACTAGCAYCCHLTVEASAPEVFLIAAHLNATLPAERLEEVKAHVRRTAAAVSGLSPGERVRAAVPCALLQNGQCSVYAVRPTGCRSWNSWDVRACAQVMQDGGGDLRPVQDQRPSGIESGVRAGFAAALQSAGLPEDDTRRCELNTALAIALEDPSALTGWLDGTDTLAASRAAVGYGKV